jgi:asparagine N-glycosylation enzyme membrane subunit Stt3
VPYVVFISSFQTRFARNLLPVSVPVAAMAVLGLVAVVERVVALSPRDGDGARASVGGRLAAATSGRLGAAALMCVCLAALVWPATEARAVVDKYTPDPWDPAREWLEAHIPEGERIAIEAYGVYVDPERYEVTPTNFLIERQRDVDWYRTNGYGLLIASERQYQRYLDAPTRVPEVTAAYEQLLADTCTLYAAGPEDERVLLLDPTC